MTTKELIYANAIMVIAFVMFSPALLLICCDSIVCIFSALFYAVGLSCLLHDTRRGRWFIVEFYRSYLRLERYVLGCNV